MTIKTQFLKNLVAAFLAQGVGLILNIILSLAVPKILGITEYGYWQLFIFYTGYVGFFHFGWADGLYLRLGGREYRDLDFKTIGAEYKIFLLTESTMAILILIVSAFVVDDLDRMIVFVGTALYMVLYNAALFLSYIYQAVNEIKIYSISVIIDRIFLLVIVILLLLKNETSYIPFVVSYTLSKIVSLIYLFGKGRKIIFPGKLDFRSAIKDVKENILVGSNLMLANIASLLILGVGRMIIDRVWGIDYFGKISFSLSLTNFFLLFIQQVSMVLFPVLRKVGGDKLVVMYSGMKTLLQLVLPVSLVFYIPIKNILTIWLPGYSESLKYLALLLPICIFDGKMQMLYNTYLKVLREERKMLQINIVSLIVSALFTGISGLVFHDFLAVIISMLVAVAFRCILAELYLSKKMIKSNGRSFLGELLLVIIFIMASWNLNGVFSFIIILSAYIVYLLFNYKSIYHCIENFR